MTMSVGTSAGTDTNTNTITNLNGKPQRSVESIKVNMERSTAYRKQVQAKVFEVLARDPTLSIKGVVRATGYADTMVGTAYLQFKRRARDISKGVVPDTISGVVTNE